MANSGLQILGFMLSLLGWIAALAATCMPQWQMSSFSGMTLITAQAFYKGLWMECVMQSTGQMQCKNYDSILSLDSSRQATRALMVVCLVLGAIGMGVAIMGMKCTNCGSDDKVVKARIAMTGGIIFMVAGLCALIACSWIGHQTVQDFYNTMVATNNKYEFGYAIFIGWGGSALLLLGGGLLSCSCPGKTTYGGRQYPQGKPISKPPSTKEYV